MTKPSQDRSVIAVRRGAAIMDLSPSIVIPLFQPFPGRRPLAARSDYGRFGREMKILSSR
jgi:hypothetical protein